MTHGSDRPFLTVSETARALGVHENTVRNWVRAGTLVSARLPGSKQHRFAREEVQRLLARRGNPASSISPQLRVDGPELVSAADLDQWAGRSDAKTAFPDLMRRLLAATPGISNIDVRAYEGTAAPGWDGSATSTGSAFLPAGELRFEFGTEKDSRRKAQEDYEKRVLALPQDEDAVFIFATPRNWATGRGWASEIASENRFAGTKVIDAHVLEGWLHATPSVHYWISERLGRHPRDAQAAETWWADFQGRIRHKIPASFFSAGRAKEAALLLALVKEGSPTESIPTVRSPWRDESMAFTYAALESEPTLLHRTVVVRDSDSWGRLARSTDRLILVPLFEGDVDLNTAQSNGHRIILVAGGDEVVPDGKAIELPKVDRAMAGESLKQLDLDFSTVERMVALGRRSMPALFRSLAREPRLATPDWVKDSRASSILAPLALAGSWSALGGDAQVIETLTGVPEIEVESLLKALERRPDAPFVLSGGRWRLVSPTEAAYLLLREMKPSDFDRWRDVVLRVLLADDPFSGMDTVARLTASTLGTTADFSETLQEHLADGLALAAATADDLPAHLHMQARVDSVVRSLLERAADDRTGNTWSRLSKFLPALAEAAPEILQDAIEADLSLSEPLLKSLFRDSEGGGDIFGPSSPHPSLLWALEKLCWAPDYFGRAARILTQLVAIDPGGRLSNRPIESLRKVTSGWIVLSGATVEDKIAVIDRALRAIPDVGWQLLMAVWPSAHAVAFSPTEPKYRDWGPKKQSVSYADWGRYVEELTRLASDAAGGRADRWKELIPKIDDMPPRERADLVKSFSGVSVSVAWNEEERYAIWHALNALIAQHEEYSDAQWAMSKEDLQPFRDIAARLAPIDDPRRYASLFDWSPPVTGHKFGDDGYDAKLEELRDNAIQEVLAQGVDQLEELIDNVPLPGVVGAQLAEISAPPESEIIRWLEIDRPSLHNAAMAYARRRVGAKGPDWLRAALDHISNASAREQLMGAVPFTKVFWTEVGTLEEPLQNSYWQNVTYYDVPDDERVEAVGLLLQHERPWQAVGLLSIMLHREQQPDIDLVCRALRAVIEAPGPADDRQMSSYNIGQLLQYLERVAPDSSDLPMFEFTFFEFTHDHEPSRALYRALAMNPSEFVSLVRAVYRGDGEARRKLTPQEQAYAGRAWSVLRHWPVLPGLREDGTIDSDHLTEWVRLARTALAELGRSSIGDEQIGQVLASSPVGADGVWPAEEVREIVENLVNTRIDTGLHIGRTNQRGITSRAVYDGGDQERALELEYRNMAAQIATRWPRTARVLRGIADSYQQEAVHHDTEAERLGDDG